MIKPYSAEEDLELLTRRPPRADGVTPEDELEALIDRSANGETITDADLDEIFNGMLKMSVWRIAMHVFIRRMAKVPTS